VRGAGKHVKILIADDDTISRTLLERALGKEGYDVIPAENGQQAIEILTADRAPRLALLDWVMPEVNGPDVCRAVRAQREKSYQYLLLLSSKESKSDIVSGLESGADDYVTKPFDLDELKARLRAGVRILELQDRLVEARETMRYHATHDNLTSLLNRGVIVNLLGMELIRSQRENRSTAILLCDIDNFKKINDTYGHLVGDQVLREVSSRFLSAVRSYDFVGRYGGEEFLIVLNNCDPASSFSRAEQVLHSLSNPSVSTSAGLLPITGSIGVLLSIDWPGRAVEEVLHEVDLALYAAKQAGRNCVRMAKPIAILKEQVVESAIEMAVPVERRKN
jgi:two-component system, cell cycle response regulator